MADKVVVPAPLVITEMIFGGTSGLVLAREMERMNSEVALTATQISQIARLLPLVERIPHVIWTKSTKECSTFFTANASALFGIPLETLQTSAPSTRLERVHPDDVEVVIEAFTAYLGDGATFDLEYRYRHPDGRWLWLRERAFPCRQREGSTVYEGMITDVTEKHRLEDDLRQSQKMEALGQLTGGIAHDFNNILATILATSEFLMDALPEGDPRRDDAKLIYDSTDRAAALTRQLLAFSRRQVLEPRVLDLNAAVTGVQRMLRSIIRENIAFTFLPSATLGTVRIDLGQLEQVIMNLVVNACDAMPAGGMLTIETADDIEGSRVLLRVRDTGHGMDEATQRRIFEPFFTTKEKGYGTGLGLATCWGIVEQSGGRIDVESERGRGTSFTISLPRLDEPPCSEPVAKVALEIRGDEAILLIEDDPDVRRVMKRLFTRRGYTVLTAQNAREALAIGLASDCPIDLVVSDIILPGAIGPSIVEQLRTERPQLKALFVSGYHDLASLGREATKNLCIIEKPFKPERLLSAVRDELAR